MLDLSDPAAGSAPASAPAQRETDRDRTRAVARDLAGRFRAVRAASLALCEPLSAEDCVIQSMPDVSPPKWHLAHTTWFFETFVLEPFCAGYRPRDAAYGYLFNSYYERVGARHPRPERGLLSRPSLDEVVDYRVHVDEALAALLDEHDHGDGGERAEIARRVVIGLHHEQQHQELLLMDVKHNFWRNPLRPAYVRNPDTRVPARTTAHIAAPLGWRDYDGGLRAFGVDAERARNPGAGGFAFDNETPVHRAHVAPFRLASRLVTCGEFAAFIADGGYDAPTLWLSDGWATAQRERWRAPLYWERDGDGWRVFTMAGMQPLDPAEPVMHVSYYEADAYARWAGRRLPGEREWEWAAKDAPPSAVTAGNFVESGALHARPAPDASGGPDASDTDSGEPTGYPAQLFGDAWEWTRSPYQPYPGYRPLPGALGEYNGKFMCNQMVLRGGSCFTPASHIRATYRNFFYPHQRWNAQGFRLADDAG